MRSPITHAFHSVLFHSSWAPFVLLAVISLVAVLLFRNVGRVSFPNPTDMFASERKAKFVRVDLMTQQGKSINFKDVAGLKEAKTEVMEFIGYLKHPQKFKVRKERKVGDKRYEARSRGRSSPDTLAF